MFHCLTETLFLILAFSFMKLRIDEHYFGGREVFYNDLLNKGLLRQMCLLCKKTKVSLYFIKSQNFPRT